MESTVKNNSKKPLAWQIVQTHNAEENFLGSKPVSLKEENLSVHQSTKIK